MPYSFMLCGRAIPETALWPFQRWPTGRVVHGCLPPLLDTPRRTPMPASISSIIKNRHGRGRFLPRQNRKSQLKKTLAGSAYEAGRGREGKEELQTVT
jgi:hypothetical protein